MATPLDVLVLAGGLSHERDVSLSSGSRVAEALIDAGVSAHVADVDSSLIALVEEVQPDVVWPLLHGSTGEDGSVRDLLEILGVPYVGTSASGARIAWNKPAAKTVVGRSGLSTPLSATLPQSIFREVGAKAVLDRIVTRLGLPLVVKPAQGGSALGVSLVTSIEALPQAMVSCFSYADEAIIEQAITGVEVGVSVVCLEDGVPQALPPVEVVVDDGLYDYDARYNSGRSEYFVPARLDAATRERVEEAAILAHTSLGLRGLSRSDLIVDAAGTIWFLEVNSAPGMTETSLFPLAAQASGWELPELYRRIAQTPLVTAPPNEG